ncbi:hypothetical protein AB0C76_15450 [Kitasatospora sp. NPDC048722]|uniref:hypothetical protein n=1 Tax=Kitasatospora sp. NPDC048722 TaxID=3155639 RepID=UPI0033D49AE3
MSALRQAWRYLADQRVGTTAEQRLLALVCVCRAAGQGDRAGRVNLTSRDLTGLLALADPAGALDGLLAAGWMYGPRDELLDGDPSRAVEFRLRASADGGLRPVGVPEKLRSRMSGLAQRVLGCRRLGHLPAEVRLAAAYLTAHAGPGDRGEAGLGDMAAACLLDRAAADAAVAALVATRLVSGHQSGDGRLLYHLRNELVPTGGAGRLPGLRRTAPARGPGGAARRCRYRTGTPSAHGTAGCAITPTGALPFPPLGSPPFPADRRSPAGRPPYSRRSWPPSPVPRPISARTGGLRHCGSPPGRCGPGSWR